MFYGRDLNTRSTYSTTPILAILFRGHGVYGSGRAPRITIRFRFRLSLSLVLAKNSSPKQATQAVLPETSIFYSYLV